MRHWRAELNAVVAAAALFRSLATAGLQAAEMAGTPATNPAAGADTCREPVCLTAGRLEADATHLTLHDFNIIYAARGTTVTGDLAEGESAGGDSKNTRWVLTGHVQITIPQGHLKADRATMQIVNGRISSMTAEGSPAEFDRGGDTPPPAGTSNIQAALVHAHGHARQIVYDLDHGQLELSGDGFLTNGCYEFTSEHMSYDIANQRVQADPHDGGSVHGKLPRNASSCPGAGMGISSGSGGSSGGDKP